MANWKKLPRSGSQALPSVATTVASRSPLSRKTLVAQQPPIRRSNTVSPGFTAKISALSIVW